MRERIMSIEIDQKPAIVLKETVPAPGLGDKNSSISIKKYEDDATKEVLLDDLREIVRSGECIAPCYHHDDGCIDGRCANQLVFPEDGDFATKDVSDNSGNERAKVAGGGLITGLAMHKALGEGIVSPEEDIAYIAAEFAKQNIYCGAHTGSHANGGKTDCGANDRFDEIINNAISNRAAISQFTEVLVQQIGQQFDQNAMDQDINQWTDIVNRQSYFMNSDGVTRLDAISEGVLVAQKTITDDKKASVIKNLGGGHNEVELEVMCEEDYTFSQTRLRDALIARNPDVNPDDLPQVFVLDLWRVHQLAEAIAQMPERTTGRLRTEDEVRQRYSRALHAGVAYQVGTYITLTDGSLDINVFAGAA